MTSLELRIEKMEKQLRLYRILFSVIVVAAGFFLFTSFDNRDQVQNIIKAKEMQVVDESGRVMVSLKKDLKAGNIKIFNEKGSDIVHMLESDAGTGVVVTKTKNGNKACRLIDYSNGEGGLIEVYNKDGLLVSEIGSTTGGGGFLGVKNTSGKRIGEIGATDAQTGYMVLNNANGNYLVRATYTNSTYGGWLGVYNSSGKNIFRISNTTQGADFSLMDHNEKERMNLGITANNDGAISVYNRSNNRISTMGGDNSGNGALNILNSYGQNMNGVWPKQ
jgi:hypothetical protein